MICQTCRKRAATTHVTDVGRAESHYCKGCAKKAGAAAPKPDPCGWAKHEVPVSRAFAEKLRKRLARGGDA